MKTVRKRGGGPMKEKNKQDCEGGGNSSKRKLARHSVDWAVSTAPTAEQIGAIVIAHLLGLAHRGTRA